MTEKKTVRDIVPAVRDDIADLVTYRALPTHRVEMIDPFLFLNHHGPQVYAPSNRGLPFGPHPHRGFQTVTFILDGDIAHRDSGGHESVIEAGGVQWMVAGSGLVHSETSSPAFKQRGGPMEILQLWVNLPARLKMTEPYYAGLSRAQIPEFGEDGGRVAIQLTAGEWNGRRGAIEPPTDMTVMTLGFRPGGRLSMRIAAARNLFFYVVRGALKVNGAAAERRHLVRFDNDGEGLEIESDDGATVLLCHAEPFGEPVVAHGPFVMNTADEIRQAIADYQAGRFG
jgi:redox-sensitive bicupin YhaK (pirin superfamily)